MSIDITIGELIEDRQARDPYQTVFRWVEPKAPLFPGDDIVGHGNQRKFDAGQYLTFANATGLRATLLAPVETALDGVRDLSEADLALVLHVGAEWQATYHATPTFESDDEADWHLARLLWFA